MRRLRKLPKNYVLKPQDRTLFLVARSAIRGVANVAARDLHPAPEHRRVDVRQHEAAHVVPGGHELWHQPVPEPPRGSRHEQSRHVSSPRS